MNDLHQELDKERAPVVSAGVTLLGHLSRIYDLVTCFQLQESFLRSLSPEDGAEESSKICHFAM